VQHEIVQRHSVATANTSRVEKTSVWIAGWDGIHLFLRSADGNFETNLLVRCN
jgi:hypothetical protein